MQLYSFQLREERYPEGWLRGKETSNGIQNTSKPENVFQTFEKHILESLRIRL